MNKGTISRASKLLLAFSAIAAFAINTTFATTLIPVSDLDTSNYIDQVLPGGPGGGNQILAATDGTWTFNTNSSAALWSNATNWSGGIIADGGGKADFSTINITGARNPVVDTTRTVGRLDIGDTDNLQSYTISASVGASLIFDNTANS